MYSNFASRTCEFVPNRITNWRSRYHNRVATRWCEASVHHQWGRDGQYPITDQRGYSSIASWGYLRRRRHPLHITGVFCLAESNTCSRSLARPMGDTGPVDSCRIVWRWTVSQTITRIGIGLQKIHSHLWWLFCFLSMPPCLFEQLSSCHTRSPSPNLPPPPRTPMIPASLACAY